ncbi:hypothetical protein [Campylobacter concisus]|uniref:hypothetical protein n=1 Tax=Campylobacter concisus TaxID=199 RepID=UPI00122CF78D|nr:hypothetical protein [Campylobacter concisus]
MLRKILFFILIAFMISGCSYKETVSKTDKLQGIYMHNGGYYILGDKFSYKLNETSKIDEIKEFYQSDFSKNIIKDFAKVDIDEASGKMVGDYFVSLGFESFTDNERNRLYSTFKSFKKKETLNLGADSKFKKFLIGGFHLSGDVIKISNDEKNRILSLGKFKNPISVDINYAYSRKASSEAVMLLTAQIILFPIEVGAAAATVLTMPVWVPAFCVFSKCSN